MKFTKKELKPVIVLGVICIVVALLVAGVNSFTGKKIEEDKQTAINNSLTDVMPGGNFENVTSEYDLLGSTVTAVYRDKNGAGHVVTLSTAKGYTGNPILLTIAIADGDDGKGIITGAVVTNNPESKGTEDTNAFFAALEGKNPDETLGVDLITGVTYSSTAVRNAALDAFRVLGYPVPEIEAAPRVENFTVWSGVGIAIAVLAIGGAVAYIIVKRRKGI
jgi:Na+-translocating ferredoxin:NAD+ oxidoreductase RnfG subunit